MFALPQGSDNRIWRVFSSAAPYGMAAERDCWAEWLADRRFGGDSELERAFIPKLEEIRDAVLDHAALVAGESVLDVGCGEGLIGFGALKRGAGSVVFSDISKDLVSSCRHAAVSRGLDGRCRFVIASADDLAAVEGDSVDVVTTRSVLIYVEDKRRAFEEFFRVLRPGGRISLSEPIPSYAFPEPAGRFWGYDVSPIPGVARKLRQLYDALQPPTDPMFDFDERDLTRFCEEAGFFPVNLLFRVEVAPNQPVRWETCLSLAWNPKVPALAEAMQQVLSAEEREQLTTHLRPLVERGEGGQRGGHAYLWAVKPT